MNPNATSYQWDTSNSGNDNPYMGNNYYGGESYDDNYSNQEQHGYYGVDSQQEYEQGFVNDPSMIMDAHDHHNDVSPQTGSFYLLTEPYMPHIQGAPVSALAIDPFVDTIYTAGHTIPLKKHGFHRMMSSSAHGSTQHRVSMLSTHTFPDGMIYSAIAAHEEARREILDDIIASLYGSDIGGASLANNSTGKAKQSKIPKHAYRPPYGRPLDPTQQASLMPNSFQMRQAHMGITKILPFHSPSNNMNHTTNEGYLCTISPSSVRVHNRGGLLLSENKIEGLFAGTFHPGMYQENVTDALISSNATHVTVGGISANGDPTARKNPNLYCFDLYSSTLKEVASHTVYSSNNKSCAITDITTSHETCNLVAGCSDGTLRIFDGSWRGGNYMECAKVKAHRGGIAQVAVSGNLICTTGYSSRSRYDNADSLFAFPDEHVLVFDIRYLGRGGIAHPFSGLNGGPRFISFLPPSSQDESGDRRVLVGSGQLDGGLQIMTPFQGLMNADSDLSNYIKPPLNPSNESITAMQVVGKDLAIGTSLGNLFQYRLAESNNEKEQLILPTYGVEPPPLSIDPFILKNGNHYKDVDSHSIFNSYVLKKDPCVSSLVDAIGKRNPYSFGNLTDSVILPSSRRLFSKELDDLITEKKNKDDFLITIPTSELDLDLGMSKEGTLYNPNKLLHGENITNMCYNVDADPRKREKKNKRGRKVDNDDQIPSRYAGRQNISRFSVFDIASLNDTIYPGWDYSGPNAYACSVLLLLYFVPEIRCAMLHSQMRNFDQVVAGKKAGKVNEAQMTTELGFLYHQIDSLAAYSMVYPKPPGEIQDPCQSILGAFVPANFLSTFMTMPEASALALLDGNPAATEVARRPEAFYRFLLHHLDSELSSANITKKKSTKSNSSQTKLIDSLYGMNAVSMNQFVNEGAGTESISVTRSNTVDLAYEAFLSKTGNTPTLPDFGELLRFSLCKDIPLRAWCNSTKQYETVIQRKIITSLPVILSLSCSCAGVNGTERLPIWRKIDGDDNWLPEMIEIEIEESGDIITRQLRGKEWQEYKGEGLPKGIAEKVKQAASKNKEDQQLVRYQLQAIIIFVNNESGAESKEFSGHHVLHHRIPKSHTREILLKQLDITQNHLISLSDANSERHLTLIKNVTAQDLEKRIEKIKKKLKALDENEKTHEWVLFNGPNVTSTVIEDALAFHVPFKEPCILTYRQVDTEPEVINTPKVEISAHVLNNIRQPAIQSFNNLIAIDAEFVQVQHEDSILTATGSKMILREGRNALGRMSIIDCKTGNTILDDHVLPREPVVDYLTRFSGIKPSDLDPKVTPYHLISSKHAYLKMRYLVDRGCIFVGHGLSGDFSTVNIFVPPSQIVDTTDIFHLERRRLISLRFLVNYLLGRDMQQDVHDSIEDSMAACELYMKALQLKKDGLFDKVLNEIYEFGQKIDWKVGELRK